MMEANSVLSSSFNPPKTLFSFISKTSSARFPQANSIANGRRDLLFPRAATLPLTMHNPTASNSKDILPKIDQSGRFCSPRGARELALMILYAACLEGYDPVRLFEKRINARKEFGGEID